MTFDLFDDGDGGRERRAPLADRMRPRRLDDVVGQEHLLAAGRPFRRELESGQLSSMVLWGPPGSGKTTIARLMAEATQYRFVAYSAVTSGVREIREVVRIAEASRKAHGRPTLLFVDEIHRFNKAQQDAFLPHVESGLIVLVGATTENPSFSVNSALLSRLRVFVLEQLGAEAIESILVGAVGDAERGLGQRSPPLAPGVLAEVAGLSGGDARTALNLLEAAVLALEGGKALTGEHVRDVAGRPVIRHDRGGDAHYDSISALIKSVRGSDPDGAVYWLARLIEGGEDPLFIARRLVILASEDVGNADPAALPLATAAFQATHMIGLPEAGLVLCQATIYLALAPKSNTAALAIMRARDDARRTGTVPVPLHLRNAPTNLMRELGHGRDYRYSHSEDDREQEYLPESLRGRRYVELSTTGYEEEQRRAHEVWRARRRDDTPADG